MRMWIADEGKLQSSIRTMTGQLIYAHHFHVLPDIELLEWRTHDEFVATFDFRFSVKGAAALAWRSVILQTHRLREA